MSQPTSRRPRLPLAFRVFLLVATLLTAAVGAAVWLSLLQGDRITRRAVDHALEASSAVQSAFAEQRLKELELITQLIAVDPAFVNYIADAQNSASATTLDDGLSSIYDLLKERQEAYGFDLGIVLDGDGGVLARSDQADLVEANMADDPFLAGAVEQLTPVSGYWRMGHELLQATVFPLAQGGDLVGFLLLGKRVDNTLGERIRRVSDADIAFVAPLADERIRIVGSSLEPARKAALQEALDGDLLGLANAVRMATRIEHGRLRLDGSDWVVRATPLDAAGGAEVGAAIQLTSYDEAAAGYRSLLNTVAFTGLAALAVALPLSLLLVRASLRPLREMARAAQEAASGNYQARFEPGGRDELAALGNAFDSLLSDLRGERDIEAYVTHLSRLLPEPGDADPGTSLPAGRPAQQARMLVLALDLRGLLQASSEHAADRTVEQAAEVFTGIALLAREHGGEWLGHGGSQLLLGFHGEHGLAALLGCARELFASESTLTAAAMEGEVTTGSLRGEGHLLPIAVGAAAQHVQRLLVEAEAGQLMLPRGLGERVKSQLAEALVTVARGASSGKPFYCISAAALAAWQPPASAATIAPEAAGDGFTAVTAGGLSHADGANLPVGTQLGGRYRILSVLGSGGMGVVYRARDLELDDVVALKMLKGAALRDSEQLDRLKSEIKLARRITHPNVLRTFDFGEFYGNPYISMEYVRGMTLRYLLKQTGRVPFTAALRLARQLCAGLQAAHEVGVLHRDIKPENLILEASGNAKLMDFGIARPIRRDAREAQLEEGIYLGTPAYSAPEQLTGQDVDHRTDIFATGALMMELFCGVLPFEGEGMVEIYSAQMQGQLRAPSQAWPEIPKPLEAIIERCLRNDPAQRFQSATELAAELARVRA